MKAALFLLVTLPVMCFPEVLDGYGPANLYPIEVSTTSIPITISFLWQMPDVNLDIYLYGDGANLVSEATNAGGYLIKASGITSPKIMTHITANSDIGTYHIRVAVASAPENVAPIPFSILVYINNVGSPTITGTILPIWRRDATISVTSVGIVEVLIEEDSPNADITAELFDGNTSLQAYFQDASNLLYSLQQGNYTLILGVSQPTELYEIFNYTVTASFKECSVSQFYKIDDKVCTLCSTLANTTGGSEPNQLVCECIIEFSWNQQMQSCQPILNCSVDPNAMALLPIGVECTCHQNYRWQASNKRCERNCSSQAYSTGNVDSQAHNNCACLASFIWSTMYNCERDCASVQHSTGVDANSADRCLCHPSHQWDDSSSSCLVNTAYVKPEPQKESSLIGLILGVIGVIVVVGGIGSLIYIKMKGLSKEKDKDVKLSQGGENTNMDTKDSSSKTLFNNFVFIKL